MKEKSQYTKKPIPRDIYTFCRELFGTWDHLQRIQESGLDMGPEWLQRQTEYYQSRVVDMLNNHPEMIKSNKYQNWRRQLRKLGVDVPWES